MSDAYGDRYQAQADAYAAAHPAPTPAPKKKKRKPPVTPAPPVAPIIQPPIIDDTPIVTTPEDTSPTDIFEGGKAAEQARRRTLVDDIASGITTREIVEDNYYGRTAVTQSAAPVTSAQKDARNTINQVLDTYGLSSLSSYLYDVYTRDEVDITNDDALMYSIKDQPAFLTRFAGNAARKKKGLAELSPGTYVAMENAYRDLMRANGMPTGFYDSNEDFQKMIENDMSAKELQTRIQLGFNEVDQANPEVLRQIRLLYPEAGIGDSRESLAAFFLDPVKAAPILERQAKAAKIGARAYETGGIQLTTSTAEDIAARGYTDAAVMSAFSDLSTQAGLYNEMTGEAKLSQEEKIGAVFGYNTKAGKQVARRKDTRKAIFSGGGRGTATSGQTAGVTESGYGSAQ